eukprot:2380848-Pleurochrysis_carterae.AAC.1
MRAARCRHGRVDGQPLLPTAAPPRSPPCSSRGRDRALLTQLAASHTTRCPAVRPAPLAATAWSSPLQRTRDTSAPDDVRGPYRRRKRLRAPLHAPKFCCDVGWLRAGSTSAADNAAQCLSPYFLFP